MSMILKSRAAGITSLIGLLDRMHFMSDEQQAMTQRIRALEYRVENLQRQVGRPRKPREAAAWAKEMGVTSTTASIIAFNNFRASEPGLSSRSGWKIPATPSAWRHPPRFTQSWNDARKPPANVVDPGRKCETAKRRGHWVAWTVTVVVVVGVLTLVGLHWAG